MGFFEWWTDLPPWLRLGVAVVFLAISTLLFLGGRWWPWGWAVGVALLLFSGPSSPEKKGYRW